MALKINGLLQLANSPELSPWIVPNLVSMTENPTMPGTLPPLIYAKLGDNCLERFTDFARWPAGWDNGIGEPITWGTYQNLELFLQTARFATGRPPSLFLTQEGHLELDWEARDGSLISVTISPAGAHYYIEASGIEANVPCAEFEALAARLAGLTF